MTQPAASCGRCRTNGTVSEDQTNTPGVAGRSGRTIRFWCPKCASVWYVPASDAELHGRFLARAGLAS